MLPKFRLLARKPKNPPLFALDSKAPVRINPWESYLKGWVVPHSGPSADEITVGVVVDGSLLRAVYGLPRPDVASHLDDPGAKNTGFYVRFRNPKRDRRIKLVTKGRPGQTVLAELDFPAADQTAQIETYQDWLIHREASLFWPENEIAHELSLLAYRPLISVILPTLNGDPLLLDRSVQSVLAQQYAHWQLCISDDCSSDSGSHERLRQLAVADKRISLVASPRRAGIAEAQNQALLKAEGDFVVLLDENDELHPCALLEVIKRLNERDGCALLYSDEDRIDSYGLRSNPAFKSDFDPDMLLAFNYVGRLVAMRRSSVLQVGGFRTEWEIPIKLLEKEGAGSVEHIAKPLYHRGVAAASEKQAARILSDHVERSGKSAAVEPGIFPGSVRLKYSAPRAAAVAVFLRAEDGDFQVQTVRANANHGRDVFICHLPDYSVEAEIFVFINRPLETINHSFFEELAGQAMRDECGLVTGISLDLEGRVLHGGLVRSSAGNLIDPFAGFELSGVTEQLQVTRTVETLSDEFFAVRREHLEAVGGLANISSSQMPHLVHKLVMNARQRGMRVIVTPFAVATFHSSPKIPVEPVPLDDHLSIGWNPFCAVFK